jgi:PAS domain S-box-containing protein
MDRANGYRAEQANLRTFDRNGVPRARGGDPRRGRPATAAAGLAALVAPAALDALGDPFFLLDRDFRLTYVNAAAATYAGVRRCELLGKLIWEVFAGRLDESVKQGLRQAMAERVQLDLEDFDPQLARWYRLRVYPVDAASPTDAPGTAGAAAAASASTPATPAASGGLAVLAIANTERKRAEQATAVLAAASRLLTGLADAPATINSIARLAVPHLADWCTVDVLAAQGELRKVAVAHQDPAKVELAREIEMRYPPNARSAGIGWVLSSGESLLQSEITDDGLRAFAVDAEHLRLLRSLGLRSTMLVPLLARGHVLGIMVFIAAESGRIYTPEDLHVAEELAHRAALALDNARLYAEARRIVQVCPVGIVVGDRTGRIQDANESLARLLGWSRDELLAGDISWRELTAAGHRHLDLSDVHGEVAGGDSRLLIEKDYVTQDGRHLPALAGTARLTGCGDSFITFVLDMSERRRVERNLAQLWRREQEARARCYDAEHRARTDAEAASRAKDEFLAMLSHELRNPLAPILASVAILRHRHREGSRDGASLAMIDRQARHMSRLVDDLLDVSRIASGKLELRRQAVDLGEVVRRAQETCQALFDAGGQRLKLDLPAAPVRLFADPARLEQLLSNLLNNAAKFTGTAGDITIDVRVEAEGGGAVATSAVTTAASASSASSAAADASGGGPGGNGGGRAVVRVRDNGIGIPAPMLPHIFDAFYQGGGSMVRSGEGLGLGLTLVKRLVELHGGTVEAISEGPGRGTEIVVRLPLPFPAFAAPVAAAPDLGRPAILPGRRSRAARARRAPADDAPPAAAGAAGAPGRDLAVPPPPHRRASDRRRLGRGRRPRPLRLLVVEDHLDAGTALTDLLRLWGHQVEHAVDGPAALAAVDCWQPDAVLLDLGLPGCDGYEVARRLGERGAQRPPLVVAVSGYGQPQDRDRARQAGIHRHLTKPVDLEALRSLLDGLPSA